MFKLTKLFKILLVFAFGFLLVNPLFSKGLTFHNANNAIVKNQKKDDKEIIDLEWNSSIVVTNEKIYLRPSANDLFFAEPVFYKKEPTEWRKIEDSNLSKWYSFDFNPEKDLATWIPNDDFYNNLKERQIGIKLVFSEHRETKIYEFRISNSKNDIKKAKNLSFTIEDEDSKIVNNPVLKPTKQYFIKLNYDTVSEDSNKIKNGEFDFFFNDIKAKKTIKNDKKIYQIDYYDIFQAEIITNKEEDNNLFNFKILSTKYNSPIAFKLYPLYVNNYTEDNFVEKPIKNFFINGFKKAKKIEYYWEQQNLIVSRSKNSFIFDAIIEIEYTKPDFLAKESFNLSLDENLEPLFNVDIKQDKYITIYNGLTIRKVLNEKNINKMKVSFNIENLINARVPNSFGLNFLFYGNEIIDENDKRANTFFNLDSKRELYKIDFQYENSYFYYNQENILFLENEALFENPSNIKFLLGFKERDDNINNIHIFNEKEINDFISFNLLKKHNGKIYYQVILKEKAKLLIGKFLSFQFLYEKNNQTIKSAFNHVLIKNNEKNYFDNMNVMGLEKHTRSIYVDQWTHFSIDDQDDMQYNFNNINNFKIYYKNQIIPIYSINSSYDKTYYKDELPFIIVNEGADDYYQLSKNWKFKLINYTHDRSEKIKFVFDSTNHLKEKEVTMAFEQPAIDAFNNFLIDERKTFNNLETISIGFNDFKFELANEENYQINLDNLIWKIVYKQGSDEQIEGSYQANDDQNNPIFFTRLVDEKNNYQKIILDIKPNVKNTTIVSIKPNIKVDDSKNFDGVAIENITINNIGKINGIEIQTNLIENRTYNFNDNFWVKIQAKINGGSYVNIQQINVKWIKENFHEFISYKFNNSDNPDERLFNFKIRNDAYLEKTKEITFAINIKNYSTRTLKIKIGNNKEINSITIGFLSRKIDFINVDELIELLVKSDNLAIANFLGNWWITVKGEKMLLKDYENIEFLYKDNVLSNKKVSYWKMKFKKDANFFSESITLTYEKDLVSSNPISFNIENKQLLKDVSFDNFAKTNNVYKNDVLETKITRQNHNEYINNAIEEFQIDILNESNEWSKIFEIKISYLDDNLAYENRYFSIIIKDYDKNNFSRTLVIKFKEQTKNEKFVLTYKINNTKICNKYEFNYYPNRPKNILLPILIPFASVVPIIFAIFLIRKKLLERKLNLKKVTANEKNTNKAKKTKTKSKTKTKKINKK